MTDDEVLGVFKEDPHSVIFGEDAVWTVDRGTTRQEGSKEQWTG
jgi:hypothetical protein